jgi:hypothetical protein
MQACNDVKYWTADARSRKRPTNQFNAMSKKSILAVLSLAAVASLAGCATNTPTTTQSSPVRTAAPETRQVETPRVSLPQTEIQKIEDDRPASTTEISSLEAEVKRRINPFTMDEARNGISAGQMNQNLSFGGMAVQTSTRKREEEGRSFTISAYTTRQGSSLTQVTFFVKEGQVGFSDLYKGSVGDSVLDLSAPDTKASLGFRTVTLMDKDVSTIFHQTEDGGWTVKKQRIVKK